MKNKRRLALLTSLSAAPAFAAPFLAIGENAELFLTAKAEVRYEDNIEFASTDERADEILEFAPGAELAFGKNSLTSGSLSVFERFIAYSDHTRFNDELANVIFVANYEGAKTTLATNASYREYNQTTRDIRAIVASDEIAVGGTGEFAVTEKSKFGTGIQFSTLDYDPNNFVDRDTYTIPVNYFFAIRPKLDLSAGLEYRKTDADVANGDSEDYYFNVGARGEFTPKLSGNFSVGYTQRETDAVAPADDSESLLGLRSGLTYLYSEKTQFNLNLSSDFETGSTGDSQKVYSATLGATSQVAADLALRGSLGYQEIDYVGQNRTDEFLSGSLGVVYTINEHVDVSATYTLFDNSSDIANSEFTANIFSLSANLRY